MKQDIVVVSPQAEYFKNICKLLRRFDMDVILIENIENVNAGLTMHSPAFLLLDGDMKGAKRFLAEMAERTLYPPPYIIVVSSFDCITMLNIGADACISKPVAPEEILSVIRAVLRRESRLTQPQRRRLLPRIEHKALLIDPLRRTVTMRGNPVSLTKKEFDILYLLAYRAGTVLTRKEIFESVWKEAYHEASTGVTDHISSLRRKLGLHKRDEDYIETVFGVGYRFPDTKEENYSCDG